MTTVIGEDVQTTPVVAEGNEYTFDVFSDYSFLALQYVGEQTPSVHFDRITRQVLEIDPTDIGSVIVDHADVQVVSTQIYNLSGQPVNQLGKGVNIVREKYSDGQYRIRKIMVY